MGDMSAIPGGDAFELRGGEVAILMIHGFTGSPLSIRPWADSLHQAGFTVHAPLLPGHGTTWSEMNETSWRDWFGEVERAFDQIRRTHRRVFVAGFSMGGALALLLASKRRSEIEGLLVVNPSVSDPRAVMSLVPVLKYFIPSIKGRGTDVAAPNPPRHSYGRTPLKALHSLQRLWRVVQRELHRIDTPMLIGYSVNDHVVDPKNSELVIDGVASVDIREVIFERSFHNVALDHDADLLAQESIDFIRDVLAGEIGSPTDRSIDATFESIVAGLDLDQSTPNDFLDQLDEIDAASEYRGDNRPFPKLTPIQRGALLGVTLGPAYMFMTAVTSLDPLGLGSWPGLLALVAGMVSFFWQLRPDQSGEDGVAL